MIAIESNGSRWAGGTPATVDELVEVMGREALCPSFLDLMGPGDRAYEGAARRAVPNPDWNHESPPSVWRWIDGPPIHPEAPDAVRFFGNFRNLSHVFCIDTDEPETIERLRAAIAANMDRWPRFNKKAAA